jgi:cytochrome c-type biogenesis protein CcmH
MASFWIFATLMTLVALAFVLVPLLRSRTVSAPSSTEANLDVLRQQRREIEADIANGTLPASAREEALADLVGRAGEDLAPERAASPTVRKPWAAAAVTAVAIPALAFGLYLAIGNPAATNPLVTLPESAQVDDKQILAMVESLARKVRDRPDDAQGWALLARSMAALGRFEEASDAYAHLVKLVPGDAQILADYADTLGMAQGRSLAGKPLELAREALRLDPANFKALALAGTAALDSGDFTSAIGYWERLAAALPADSADAAQVRSVVEEIRGRAAASGRPAQGAPKAIARAPAAAGATVSGSVSIAPALANKVAGTETLFIFARAEGGPRVPLAVVRASARQLPMQFTLDDTQAMAPGMNLSSAQAVRIEARVSRSGNASPQPGDLVGTSDVVKPGARGLRIVVDKELP